MPHLDAQLVLASQSPRRQELLRQLGLHFVVAAADLPEQPAAGEAPADYARRIALAKARAAAARRDDGLPVLGADTDVVCDGRILGKPQDRAHGLAMLGQLAGRSHQVYSAVAVVQGGRAALRLSVTEVEFGPIAPAQAAAYWDSGEPPGKAGGYAIQGLGGAFVRAIRGSYSGVVGLPIFETCELLRAFGVDALAPHAARQQTDAR